MLVTDLAASGFLLRMCHDMKTSLRAIRAHTELLARSPDLAGISDLGERVGFIVEGTKRVDLLADGLSNFSLALEIDREAFQPVAMNVMLRSVLGKMDQEIRSNDAMVTYEALPRVMGDPDRLIQVFEHLVRNALQHRGEAAPEVRITAEKHDDHWLFAVQDRGPGVEGAYLETIFKPFERLHGRRHGGPGLGLTVCRAIVERHGGRIWAESQVGNGTTVFFTLPA
jgi:light-regulated signal transduction histidine kinase (bacteriophytochrome)